MQIKIKNIKWDIDNNEDSAAQLNLPTEIIEEFNCDDKEELDDMISNWLSDSFGYCHFGFDYEIEKGEK